MIKKIKFTSKQLVPDVAAIAREMTSGSLITLILNRVKVLTPSAMVTVGINNLPYLMKLARKDFSTGIKLMTELEILSKRKSKLWVLHNQMVDMAISLGNKELLLYFFDLARRYDFQPGILTYNPVRCVKFLSLFPRLPKDLVIFCPKSTVTFNQFAGETHLTFCQLEGDV